MKKTIILTLLALSLVACDEKDLDDPRIKDALNQKEVSENIESEDNQNDYKNDGDSEEDQDINRTYPDEDVKNIYTVNITIYFQSIWYFHAPPVFYADPSGSH